MGFSCLRTHALITLSVNKPGSHEMLTELLGAAYGDDNP
jgi:hypothetical protein